MNEGTERKLQEQVRTLARLHRWEVYHTFDSRRSDPGFPDLVMVKRGYPVLFAELKARTGKLSPAQQEWLAALRSTPRDRGVETYVWRPDDWEQIVRVLSHADNP